MAIYRVQGPDGVVYRIQGPDDATDAQIAAFAQQHFSASKVPKEAPDTGFTGAVKPAGEQMGLPDQAIGWLDSLVFFIQTVGVGAAVFFVLAKWGGVYRQPKATPDKSGRYVGSLVAGIAVCTVGLQRTYRGADWLVAAILMLLVGYGAGYCVGYVWKRMVAAR